MRIGEVTGDALEAWRATREQVDWSAPGRRPDRPPPGHDRDAGPGACDGHLRFIATHDAARDPDRARRMAAALEQARRDAPARSPLCFALLASWQGVVLGEKAGFRTAPAFAKGGRECYGIGPHTEAEFEACLAAADGAAGSVDAVGRAARVYLDVCFFHPFADGNGRAARLAFDFVLAREGIRVREVAPLILVPRWAHDVEGARSFLRLARALAGEC